jgi:rubrerythrin
LAIIIKGRIARKKISEVPDLRITPEPIKIMEEKFKSEKMGEKHMQFKCRHCGYTTSSWKEIEMKNCPNCGNISKWVSSRNRK